MNLINKTLYFTISVSFYSCIAKAATAPMQFKYYWDSRSIGGSVETFDMESNDQGKSWSLTYKSEGPNGTTTEEIQNATCEFTVTNDRCSVTSGDITRVVRLYHERGTSGRSNIYLDLQKDLVNFERKQLGRGLKRILPQATNLEFGETLDMTNGTVEINWSGSYKLDPNPKVSRYGRCPERMEVKKLGLFAVSFESERGPASTLYPENRPLEFPVLESSLDPLLYSMFDVKRDYRYWDHPIMPDASMVETTLTSVSKDRLFKQSHRYVIATRTDIIAADLEVLKDGPGAFTMQFSDWGLQDTKTRESTAGEGFFCRFIASEAKK